MCAKEADICQQDVRFESEADMALLQAMSALPPKADIPARRSAWLHTRPPLAAHAEQAHIQADGSPLSYVHLRRDLRGNRKRTPLEGSAAF